MIEDVDLKDFITREELQALLKKELEHSIMMYPKKEASEDDLAKTTADSDLFTKKHLEITENPHDNEIPDSTHLLDSFETLKLSSKPFSPAVKRLEYVADSLLDVRLERLKKKEKTLPNIEEMRYDLDGPRRNRFDLYFCYIVYFIMLFLAFAFASYVWAPIFKGMIYGRPKSNISYGRHGGNLY